MFRHYFTDGRFPAGENLAAAATEAGIDGPAARCFAESDKNQAAAQAAAQRNAASGVTGVPYFIVNGKPAFSGAQPPEAFVEAFQECP